MNFRVNLKLKKPTFFVALHEYLRFEIWRHGRFEEMGVILVMEKWF